MKFLVTFKIEVPEDSNNEEINLSYARAVARDIADNTYGWQNRIQTLEVKLLENI